MSPLRQLAPATFTPTDDNLLPVSLQAVAHKKVTAEFDGRCISSGGGVILLAVACTETASAFHCYTPASQSKKGPG